MFKFASVLRNSGKREEWMRQLKRENKEKTEKQFSREVFCQLY